MYGDQSFVVLRLFGTTVHVNAESIAIMLSTALAGRSVTEAVLIVACFALGTGLHLGCHWLVSLAFGKGIDRMILTRVGRIDYRGAPPHFGEQLLRIAAGPTMNLICAFAGYAVLRTFDDRSSIVALAVETFARCSLVLAAINFLPAIPFDGGLLLQAVLTRFVGDTRAQRSAALVSIVLMWGMAILGIAMRQFVLTYLGVTMSYDVWRKHLRASAIATAPKPTYG